MVLRDISDSISCLPQRSYEKRVRKLVNSKHPLALVACIAGLQKDIEIAENHYQSVTSARISCST